MEEQKHSAQAEALTEQIVTPKVRAEEEAAERRMFMLKIVQPGLAGLMDGSVSTLAPLFAAALATRQSWEAFLVGLAASVGAGISMGFAEALSDDGSLTGRGLPWVRGGVCGLMTTAGGIGHTLPFLISDFHLAHDCGGGRRGRGIGGDQLHPAPVHGHTTSAGSLSGGRREVCWYSSPGFSSAVHEG
ncbi:MAG TPA: hypothetical protein VFS35_00950 [Terrimicrobiaceae bacterium]|nr:hypothetical protein [Terrimicrobiaceae bacterium]